MRKLSVLILSLILLAALAVSVNAAPAPPNPAHYKFTTVASGFTKPLLLTHAGDNSGRLFVVEQGGKIKIIQSGSTLATPFLDITPLVSTANEQGLLGLAFHPNYAQNGLLYVTYTDTSGDSILVRYAVSNDPNVVNTASRTQLLFIDQPYANHNGGHIAFGQDGFLYMGMGDGGSAGDPQNYAQTTNPATNVNVQNSPTRINLGKMLRLDVSQTPIQPQIWALGLRNPWRWSFDRLTGDMYIGDVGQGNWEEVNFWPANGGAGANYGWKIYEGTHAYSGGTLTGSRFPFAEYDHAAGCSVTGGYVYRGGQLPALQGVYFYGDFCSGTIWTSFRNSAGSRQTALFKSTPYSISSFGEDQAGELYVVHHGGSVVRLDSNLPTPQPTRPPGLYDDRDAAIIYSEGWILYNGAGPANNTLSYTNVLDATAEFRFNGNGVILYRTTAFNRGLMEVCIDAILPCTVVNNNSATVQWNRPLIFNLGSTATRVVRIRNLSTSYIDLDQIRVLPPPVPLVTGFYQETDPNIAYLGNWTTYSNAAVNGGSLIYSNNPTAQITFQINGDALTLYRTRHPNRGPFQLCIDAACQTVNNTTTALQWNVPITFAIPVAGLHSIVINNLSSSFIDLDAIRVGTTPATLIPGTYDERNVNITYNGLWYSYNGSAPHAGTLLYNNTPGDEIRFRVSGQAFQLYRTTAFNRGPMQVCIGATLPCTTVNNSSASVVWSAPVLFNNLGPGTHTVVIRNTSATSSQYIDLDRVDVFMNNPVSLALPAVTPSPLPTMVESTPTVLPGETPTETATTTLEASPEPSLTPMPTEVPTETLIPSPVPTEIPPTPEPTATPLPTETPTETPTATP